ncbi:MAG: hypothetical protein NC548_31365 [Lachnospiraceae bacterium]|nr:hypothetical protein [Bacteroides fragilis]MCM1219004.1 hypothetical protein [Lachnospiraceae bacterium]
MTRIFMNGNPVNKVDLRNYTATFGTNLKFISLRKTEGSEDNGFKQDDYTRLHQHVRKKEKICVVE